MYPSTPTHLIKKYIDKFNAENTDNLLPHISFHGLRHTSATLLISNNTDVKTVSHRMGHSQTSVTLDIYSHAFNAADKAATKKMDDILYKKNSKRRKR